MATLIKERKFTDPVCGMSVNPQSTTEKLCHNGQEIFFCAEACRRSFEAHPERYQKKLSPKRKKNIWQRYLDRLSKATGGRPPTCH